MTLNRLKTYKWEQGSQNNPVTLTSDEFGWLIDLIKTERINKDIRGWIRPTRDVTSYEKYLVELAKDSSGQPLLHLVDVNVSAIGYNVTLSSNKVNEGDRVKINVNNIALDALKFRIVNHTVQTEEYQNRTSIDTELGYVVVEPARENATWSDVVTIQTCPVWEDWDGVNSSIRTFDITVNAQQVVDVTIIAPDVVGPSQTFYPTVKFVPSGHTKPIVHTLEEAAQKKGICFIPRSEDFTVSKRDSKTIVAVAPVTETEGDSYYSISCDVYAFTDQSTIATPFVEIACKHPYIQFTVTTDGTFSDISGANGGNGPKVTLKKLDSDGSVLEDNLQLTKTVGEDRIIYTYGGGNVKADGKETYVASFEDVSEYKHIDDVTIVPTGIINNADIVYSIIVPDIYVVYDDGFEESYQTIVDRNYKLDLTRNAVGVAVVTADCAFIVRGQLDVNAYDWNLGSVPPNYPKYASREVATANAYDGEICTEIMRYYHQVAEDFTNGAYLELFNRPELYYKGEYHKPYMPAAAEMMTLVNNKEKAKELLENCFFKQLFVNEYWGYYTASIAPEFDSYCILVKPSQMGTVSQHPNNASGAHLLEFYPYN